MSALKTTAIRSLFLALTTAVVLMLATLAACGPGESLQQEPGQSPTPTSAAIFHADPTPSATPTAGPPPETPAAPPPTMTLEEQIKWREELRRKDIEEGTLVRAVGPETRGTSLVIGDRIVQLPEDAYVKDKADFGECAAGTSCPPAPLYMIARGSSTIGIDGKGGLFEECLAQGEEEAFDFVKRVFGDSVRNPEGFQETCLDPPQSAPDEPSLIDPTPTIGPPR